ncbi:glycosyltransferase family protein [Sphingomonas nostoxanthinifaciens]|uniref:hypothetical protein n=1 Tax=Sphingomonas nostoxanthinifaciens TaxID=2872652 RepID=UPI001CC1C3A8|nr:hypothetical protein [Sphingomonas nostoxanthinifaciens]UAK26185.1 hypothetical protein K8P63_08840 [Sphingomonas nostoxanthinifaciens]
MAAADPALTALIGAYEPGPGPGGLRALLPLAGATLVEHQVRRAVAAGAGRVLLLIETVPPELAETVARLRRDGITLAFVESIGAAADALPEHDPVLLIGDACLPEIELIEALAWLPVPALATLQDGPDHQRHERIDAVTRWAGLALLDGHRIGETAAMIGDWDPVSTLLRRAVQEDAARLVADAQPPALMVEADRRDDAERTMIEAARRPGRDWIERGVFGRFEEVVLPPLLERRVEALSLALGSSVASALAAGLAIMDWRGSALVLLLASGPLAAIAARIARVRDRPVPHGRLLSEARIVFAAVALLALALRIASGSGQWGWAVVGGAALLGMIASAREQRLVPGWAPIWLARPDGLIWAMAPLALVGRWDAGLALLALYAWAGAVGAQREALTRAET